MDSADCTLRWPGNVIVGDGCGAEWDVVGYICGLKLLLPRASSIREEME